MCKYWDVMAGIGLSGDVKVKVFIFWELLEEEHQKSVNILAGSNCVRDTIVAIAIADIDGLVEEYNGCIVIP